MMPLQAAQQPPTGNLAELSSSASMQHGILNRRTSPHWPMHRHDICQPSFTHCASMLQPQKGLSCVIHDEAATHPAESAARDRLPPKVCLSSLDSQLSIEQHQQLGAAQAAGKICVHARQTTTVLTDYALRASPAGAMRLMQPAAASAAAETAATGSGSGACARRQRGGCAPGGAPHWPSLHA